ncbi:hypothetical protein QBC34DRAFT_358303 [Podospora aff. communis PSN243]|uniref:Uncharacterized protein n=1 Tax=Podospora aff. communis PSN243 TaxID=3040156 RepID=A0AAV9GBF4_9PEZI|nr:hypothetical protein QBC34DRAFT_358303 [Podospora aff. communis PSN243]
MHELLIIASLAAVVFTHIRDRILSAGVPFGFLCSGFMFSQVSYFWSPEFWGGLTSRMSRRSKFLTASLLAVAGAIAATAGPAAAVLLVPQIQDWDAGGSEFYLQGGSEDLFPRVMNSSSLPHGSRCFGPDRLKYAFCPSGGFTGLSGYAAQLSTIKNGGNMGSLPTMMVDQFRHRTIFIPSITPGVTASTLQGSIRGVACQISVIAPFIPVVTYQYRLMDEWLRVVADIRWNPAKVLEHSTVHYRYHYSNVLVTPTRIVAVRTACSGAQNISVTATEMRFPIMPQNECRGGERVLSTPLLTQPPSNMSRITWLPLPLEFDSASTGVIFETPWVGNGSSRAVVGCSVDARWVEGTVSRDTVGKIKTSMPPGRWEPHLSPGYWVTLFRPTPDAPDAWRHVNISTSWLDLLTPRLPDTNRTTLENIIDRSDIIGGIFNSTRDATSEWNFQQQGAANRTISLEWHIAALVADGLSRHGMERELDLAKNKNDWNLVGYHRRRRDYREQIVRGGQAVDPPPSGEYTSFFLSITINGLCYKAQSVTDYLAIAILSTHILIAIGHSIYLFWRRKSSAAWDSTAEMLALAHNSQPSDQALRNTSAGIHCLKTYGKIAVVRASDPTNSCADAPRLQLVLEEDLAITIGEEVLKGGAKASTLPLDDSSSTSNDAGNNPLPPASVAHKTSENIEVGVRRRRPSSIVKPDQLYR